ncbi:MAG: MlaC/ttg2D family ABC transporter substrate-binding protein [Burkholderiaceae bacterium]
MNNHFMMKRKNMITRLMAATLAMCLLSLSSMAAEEPADALVKRVSQEVLNTVKTDTDIQKGDHKKVFELVETKIFPYVDFQRTTSMTAGRYWRQATPEQQQKLANEFRRLLINTYAGAISKAKNHEIKFKPFRGSPADNEVEVRSQVLQPGGEPIELDYRLEKTADGWKIYDLNILGAWLIETYKQTFSSEISKSGIDGLIKTLEDKNNKLARASTASKD